ncbi:ABC transporter ATP-binding protein [Lactococcus laudensis]|uniref:ABC transporter ATP-binding protein n=1 Tax=Pseudolactococcus laudensis TaxID=1494461 RepID=A0A7V8MZ65_9LACT|nr:ABC transporter ATP-binding protein [Lactococcus laudensis]MBA0015757.1 ABC transporter ATP-binding protein [Lactococcus laudensis]MBR2762965.1 ABC transporter ATP-binding protein [Lactococcus sp.]MBW9280744.1 ABC transporter ATP-binding protein [Lactococcus laudensis]
MTLMEVKNVQRVFGKGESEFIALNDVSLTIEKGESVAIIGKSGSGKSTLMHILALLDRPTKGEIILDGKDVTQIKEKQLNHVRNQQFGFVFQQFFMNAKDSVLDNVTLPLKISGVPAKRRKELAMKALQQVDLAEKAKSKANDLSGGQKQRVCVARAIINQPQVIFADEPTGNLDSTTGERIENLLFDLNQSQGITLIIVTHDEDLAARCDRKIRMRDGKIIEEVK